jgi:hypothetical protein
VQVAHADPGLGEIGEERGDAAAPGLGVVGVDELVALRRQLEPVGGEPVGHRRERRLQLQGQSLLAELAHELGLVLDQDQLALVDHADPVGHLLGLLDVVGGQDDGDAGRSERAHEAATCPA